MKKKATAAGFEPARNKSKRFLVFRLNHSAKQSSGIYHSIQPRVLAKANDCKARKTEDSAIKLTDNLPSELRFGPRT